MWKKLLLLSSGVSVIVLILWALYSLVVPYKPNLSKMQKLAEYRSPNSNHVAVLFMQWDNTLDHKHIFLVVLDPDRKNYKVLAKAYYEGGINDRCGSQLYWATEQNKPYPIKWIDDKHIKIVGHQLSIDGPMFWCE